jgi:hypothetical protein
MTKKKMLYTVMKIIRKNTGYNLPLAKNIAKKYLNEQFSWRDDCFKYEWEWKQNGNEQYPVWTGELYLWNKERKCLDTKLTWNCIPELMDYQIIYGL